MTVVAERIKQRRTELGLSVDELAKKVGISRATLYRYENGSIDKVNVHQLKPIASALMTTPVYLMGWDDEKEISPKQRLIEFAEQLPDDKVDLVLRIMKSILQDD